MRRDDRRDDGPGSLIEEMARHTRASCFAIVSVVVIMSALVYALAR